jgi:hypothetical protein
LIEIGRCSIQSNPPHGPALKKEFGNKLGRGSIDDSNTTIRYAGRVRWAQALKQPENGLIIGPTHHVQLDTPMENFWALVNTVTQTQYASL